MIYDWYSFGGTAVHPLLIVMLAFALDVAIGDPPSLYRSVPHPVALFGRLVAAAERRLNRSQRPERTRFVRGCLSCLLLVLFASAIGYGLQWVLGPVSFGWLVGAALASTLIAYRGLYDHVRAVADGLDISVEKGRSAVAHIVGRDPDELDEHGIARAAIESSAENLCDGVVAPIFWMAVLGLPGLCAYKAINTLDSMIGHRNERYEHFGKFAARLDDAVNAIPARLTGLLLTVTASIGRGTNGSDAWSAAVRDAEKHRSINAGWPEAAMAGALGLALAGPRTYQGTIVADAWMNDGGRVEAAAEDIRRALGLYRRTGAMLAALLLLIMALA